MTNDGLNRFPQWGPLVRVWHLLSDEDRARWAEFVEFEAATNFGFEPVIGRDAICGVVQCTRNEFGTHRRRRELPVYDSGGSPGGGHPVLCAALSQLIRWAEIHARPRWARRSGW